MQLRQTSPHKGLMGKSEIRNIFADGSYLNTPEHELVEKAQSGNFDALKELVSMHESRIFNISLHMTGNTQGAKDATQEILIKMLTKLSTFENKSSFRTWLYRISTNHVLNMNVLNGRISFCLLKSTKILSVNRIALARKTDRAAVPMRLAC
jgi:hypothetical protein